MVGIVGGVPSSSEESNSGESSRVGGNSNDDSVATSGNRFNTRQSSATNTD